MSDVTADIAYVRIEEKAPLPPPRRTTGVVAWMRENLFSSWSNTALTLLGAWLLYSIVPPILDWALFSATFTGTDRQACLRDGAGACWPFIDAKFDQFIYGRYPLEERWRVDWTFFLGIAGLIPMLIPRVPFKFWNALYLLLPYPIIAFFLLTGGVMGLEEVETALWGGMLVTLVVAITGIVASLPLGILLALGRRSQMPVIRMLSIGFIEIWRGVPLVTVLFMASVMLPLFLPEDVTFDKLLRCLIAVALFSAAYMAEVVRGGLQAVPRGQYEGAQALGPQLLADDDFHHPAAGPEDGDPRHRQFLHCAVQGYDAGADHRPVRPPGHHPAQFHGPDMGHPADGRYRLCVRGFLLFRHLRRHVAIFPLHGTAPGYGTPE